MYWERLELETSNLACPFITRGIKERSAKLCQSLSGMDHWLTFEIFDPLHILGTFGPKRLFWHDHLPLGVLTKEVQNQGKWGSGRGNVSYF